MIDQDFHAASNQPAAKYQPAASNQPTEPPPPDDAWWQAVLSEEEDRGPVRDERQGGANGPIAANRPAAVNSPAAHADQASNGNGVDWEQVFAIQESEATIECEVIGFNRGGLLVNGAAFHGFVPVSHLVEIPTMHGEGGREDALAAFVGRALELKVIECDPQRGRVVLSERAAQAAPGERQRLLNALQEGSIMDGRVTNVTKFGIFVDLGGIEGLVHISELSWGRVSDPEEIAVIGDNLEVMVIQINRENGRVALSTKRLAENPWETAVERYRPGDVIEAEVTEVVQFGAFARLEEGLEGLIHVSEMGRPGHVDPWQVVSQGQKVYARVLHVDPNRQRLSLRLVT